MRPPARWSCSAESTQPTRALAIRGCGTGRTGLRRAPQTARLRGMAPQWSTMRHSARSFYSEGLDTGGTVQGDTWVVERDKLDLNKPSEQPELLVSTTQWPTMLLTARSFYSEALTACYLNDTWVWNGTNWTSASPRGPAPRARYGAGMDYDAALGQVVMCGGYDGSGYY